MLRLTVAFLVLLVFSAAAFDRDASAQKVEKFSSADTSTNVSLRQ